MESKYRKFYVDWWNIRRSTIYLVIALIVLGVGIITGISYASRNNWFVPAEITEIPANAGRIVSFEGQVRITRAATRDTIIVTKETYVAAGDTVQTMSDGRAIIEMIDESRYQMRPDATIVMKESSMLFGGKDVRVLVDDGQINVRTNEQPPDTNNIVELADSESKLGPNTDASFNADGSTNGGEIRISRGGVETTIGGEQTTIGADQYATVNGGKLSPREKLLEPPRPTSPGNSSQTVDPGRGVNATFTWQDPPGNTASSFDLQVARSPYFASDSMLVDRSGMTSREFRLAALSPGTYYWRVRAKSRSGQTTNWADAWKFMVVRGGGSSSIDATDWKVERLGGNVYMISGRTGPGLNVRAKGRAVVSAADGSFRLQIASPSVETAVEIGDDRGSRTGFIISLRNGSVLRRY